MASPTVTTPSIVSVTQTGSTETIVFSSIAPSCDVAVGSTQAAANYAWFASVPCTQVIATGIPTDGSMVWVRIFALYPSVTTVMDYSFTSLKIAPSPIPSTIQLGLDADMGGFRPFLSTDPWNTDVSAFPVNPLGTTYLATTGGQLHPGFGTTYGGGPNGLPYYVVGAGQPKVPVTLGSYASQSDPGPMPLPSDASIIEFGGGDNHVIILDSVGYTEYDLFGAAYSATSGWSATSSAIFNLHTNTQRPIGWTSANAAGLPEFEGLVRYDEVVTRGVINHALSFTVQWTQQGFIAPASHAAGSCGANPSTTLKTCMPMGARYRLKAAYDCSTYSKEVQVICTAMKKYGVILTDNGANWFISGAPDPRWSDTHLGDLKSIPSSAMEMVQTGSIVNQ